MAGVSLVYHDDTRLSQIDRVLYRVEMALSFLSGLAVFALMVLAVVSVGGRNFFNQPLSGYVDWIEQAMPLIAFMGIAFVQRDGGHIRMDMVIGAVRGRVLYGFEIITTLAMLGFMVLMVWGTWAHFQRSIDLSAPWWSNDSSIDIALPLWPAKLLVPVAFSVLSLRLGLQIVLYIKAFWQRDLRPVGLPVILSPAEKAAMQSQSVLKTSTKNGGKNAIH